MKTSVIAATLLFLLVSKFGVAQKTYTWCPDTFKSKTQISSSKTVKLIITDGRIENGREKRECDFNSIKNSIEGLVRSALPSGQLSSGDSTSDVIVEVTVVMYTATFAAPMWSASTEFLVRVNGGDPAKISNSDKAYNMMGYGTAKKMLQKTYHSSCAVLVAVIQNSLTK